MQEARRLTTWISMRTGIWGSTSTSYHHRATLMSWSLSPPPSPRTILFPGAQHPSPAAPRHFSLVHIYVSQTEFLCNTIIDRLLSDGPCFFPRLLLLRASLRFPHDHETTLSVFIYVCFHTPGCPMDLFGSKLRFVFLPVDGSLDTSKLNTTRLVHI
jgi:hypothetical protein